MGAVAREPLVHNMRATILVLICLANLACASADAMESPSDPHEATGPGRSFDSSLEDHSSILTPSEEAPHVAEDFIEPAEEPVHEEIAAETSPEPAAGEPVPNETPEPALPKEQIPESALTTRQARQSKRPRPMMDVMVDASASPRRADCECSGFQKDCTGADAELHCLRQAMIDGCHFEQCDSVSTCCEFVALQFSDGSAYCTQQGDETYFHCTEPDPDSSSTSCDDGEISFYGIRCMEKF